MTLPWLRRLRHSSNKGAHTAWPGSHRHDDGPGGISLVPRGVHHHSYRLGVVWIGFLRAAVALGMRARACRGGWVGKSKVLCLLAVAPARTRMCCSP